jgi:hypothetical protein
LQAEAFADETLPEGHAVQFADDIFENVPAAHAVQVDALLLE